MIKLPGDFFEEHELCAQKKLILPQIESELQRLFEEYSNILLEIISGEDAYSISETTAFYCSDIRGFTVASKRNDSVNHSSYLLCVDKLYNGSKNNIGPVMYYSGNSFRGDEEYVFRFFNAKVQQYLKRSEWFVGVIHGVNSEMDGKLIVYSYNPTYQLISKK